MMFAGDIVNLTLHNENFRHVLHTGKHSQLVMMCLPEGTDIGEETHAAVDQTLFIVEGSGEARVNGDRRTIGPKDVIVIPAGVKHNIVNIGNSPLKLYTIYSPAEHAPGLIQKVKP